MSTYLIINILIIVIPLFVSFEKKIKFYKKFHQLLTSIIVAGSIYIFWDIIAVNRGDWSFNPQYLTGIKLFNLPLEEILFFITIPYSSIFLYETIIFFLGKKLIKRNFTINKTYVFIASAILLIISLFYLDQYYTFTVLIFCSVFLLVSLFLFKDILISRSYWLFISFLFIPFLLVNYFLTSLPIVIYNREAIWGIRLLTIPIEDFFYSFSMVSFYLFIYLKSAKS